MKTTSKAGAAGRRPEHGRHIDRLTAELDAVSVPSTPTLVEVTSSRGALQLIQHDVARATATVLLRWAPTARSGGRGRSTRTGRGA